jgi:hypothetical protein
VINFLPIEKLFRAKIAETKSRQDAKEGTQPEQVCALVSRAMRILPDTPNGKPLIDVNRQLSKNRDYTH